MVILYKLMLITTFKEIEKALPSVDNTAFCVKTKLHRNQFVLAVWKTELEIPWIEKA